MVGSAVREGLGRALRAPRLVLVLWAVKAALAALVAIPGWLALRAAISPLPEADVLRDRLSPLVLFELAQMRPGLIADVLRSSLAVLALGAFVGMAATGGALEVLIRDGGGPFARRFGGGAFRFFGRFLRLALLTAPFAFVAAGAAVVPFAIASRRARESAWEPAGFVTAVAALTVVGLVLLLVSLAQDAARVLLVRDDARRVWPALRAGFGLVLRRPLRWLAIRLAVAMAFALTVALNAAVRDAVPASTGGSILLALALAQAVVVLQSGLRVTLLGAEIAVVDRSAAARRAAPAQVPLGPPCAFSAVAGGAAGDDAANRAQ